MNDLTIIEKIAQWEKLKALVLDSVSSPITKRVYNMLVFEEALKYMVGGQHDPVGMNAEAAAND